MSIALCCAALGLLLTHPSISADAHLDAAPVAGFTVAKVENGGLLFTDNHAGVSGVDAGYSVFLGNRTLWLFGDVFLLDPHAPARNYVGGVSNCALLAPAGSGVEPLRRYRFLTDAKSGLARQVIPYSAGEDQKTRLWPFGGWFDKAANRVYLYYGRIRTTGGGALDFRIEGHGLAAADVSDPDKLVFSRMKAATGDELWWTTSAKTPLFGCAVVGDAPGEMLYIVGVEEKPGGKRGKLARVRKDRIADSNAYEYYAGTPSAPRWSRTVSEAADVEGLSDFPNELSVSYNTYLNAYLAVHSVGISEKIRLSTAPSPWGPYTLLAEIGAPHQAFAQAFCYAGKEHPELAEQHGRIVYITYADNQRYWLQLLKVTLARRGP